MARPGDPTPQTVKTLITIARGKCEFKECTTQLAVDGKFIGTVAHIAAANVGGPRYDQNLSSEQIRKIENLMLLCPNHHEIIDKTPKKYTVEFLQQMKRNHEEKYADASCDVAESEINRFAWKLQFNKFSLGTMISIPKTINDKTIARDNQVSALSKQMEQSSRTIIVGNKGSGKSVVLAQLSQYLIDMHENVLFIKCDDYLGINDLDELKKTLVGDADILEIIDSVFDETNPLTVICDSLDAISRNEKSMNLFKNFLKLLWGTKKVKTVCSVRSYDYEYSPAINQTDWGKKYDLSLLTDEELDKTLAELGSPNISIDLKNILTNPLHLKLLSLIVERSPDADFTNIKNEIELYDEHWNEYVSKLEHPPHVRATLYCIAKKMSSLQRISIPYDEFGSLPAMQQILSRNIIVRDDFGDTISFFHHAYLDYTISRFILAKHSEFVDYLSRDEYNVFLRPTIIFALVILHKRDPVKSIKVIEKMLGSSLKYFWKISSLTALARIDKSESHDFTNLGKYLSKKMTLQRYTLRSSRLLG